MNQNFKITFKRRIVINIVPIGHPQYREKYPTIEIEVHGKDEYGEYADLFYCTQETLVEMLEYINRDDYIPTYRLKEEGLIW